MIVKRFGCMAIHNINASFIHKSQSQIGVIRCNTTALLSLSRQQLCFMIMKQLIIKTTKHCFCKIMKAGRMAASHM